MLENPYVAVTFWWTLMERSVRVEGKVSKITDKENDDYYNSRCYGAKIGAWVSDQSRPVTGFDDLIKSQQMF